MNKKSSNTRYFMIELVINSVFFIFAAAVSLNLFVLGRAESIDSMNLSMATIEAQNVAEIFKSIEGDTEDLISFLSAEKTDDGFVMYYDKDWNRTNFSEDAHELTVDIYNNDSTVTASVSVIADDEIIFKIDVMKYIYAALR